MLEPAKHARRRTAPPPRASEKKSAAPPRAAHPEPPDVFLDVPQLHVDEIELELDDLKAHVALEARVLDLLHLDVGVDVELHGVSLKISGVDVEAQLKVRLENLAVILNRVMDTIDANPQLLGNLTEGVSEIGRSAGALARAAEHRNGG